MHQGPVLAGKGGRDRAGRNQPLEALECGLGGDGWAGDLGKLRECPSLPTIPFHILLLPPGAEHDLQLEGGD